MLKKVPWIIVSNITYKS